MYPQQPYSQHHGHPQQPYPQNDGQQQHYGYAQQPYGQYQQPYGYPPQPPLPPPKRKTNAVLAVVVILCSMAGAFSLLVYVGDGPAQPFRIDRMDEFPGEYTFGVFLRAIVIFPLWGVGPSMAARTVPVAWVVCVWNAVAAGLLLLDPVFFAEGQFAAYFQALELSQHNPKPWMVLGTVLTSVAAVCALIAALTPTPPVPPGPPMPPGSPPQQQQRYPPPQQQGYPSGPPHSYPPPQPPRQW